MQSENLVAQYEGKYVLKCRKCGVGIITLENPVTHELYTKKPKGLRVGNYKCNLCGGAMGEATVRACYKCKRKRVILVRASDEGDRCPDCGDKQGYASIYIRSVRMTGVRTLRNGVWVEEES